MAMLGLIGVVLTSLIASGAALAVPSDGQEEFMVSVEGGESPIADLKPSISIIKDAISSARVKREAAVCGLPYNLNEADKIATVEAHNKMRRIEGATAMLEMEWDDGLARRAHQWASQCEWKHGMLSDCSGASIGQNLYVSRGFRGFPNVSVSAVIANGWWAERKFYDATSLKCAAGKMCGHYTQVVWAKSLKVGCSIVHCPTMTVGTSSWTNAVYYACDYSPPGNYVGEKPYTKGTACSNCAGITPYKGGYTCRNGLCAMCDPVNNSGDCKCVKRECGDGTFDDVFCTCKCPAGKWGEKCVNNCGCVDKEQWCAQVANMCDDRRYGKWLSQHCAGTCPNTCVKPPPGECGNDANLNADDKNANAA